MVLFIGKVMQMLEKKSEQGDNVLITTLPLVDAYLRGGLPAGSITEVICL